MGTTRDLKLRALVVPFQTVQQVTELKTSGLSEVHEAYGRNLNRVYALMVFTPAIVHTAGTLTEITTRLHLENFLKPESARLDRIAFADELEARIAANANERRRVLEKKDDEARKKVQQEIFFGFDAIQSFLQNDLSEAADAWLSAQLTGTWTAFEAMAEELWINALNLHPRGLAELKGAKKGSSEDKKVDLKWLQMHDYDLSSKMGFVLSKRYSFDKLDEIRNAYNDAFGDDENIISTIISNRDLDALALTRHVIVHNGGIMDAEYLKRKSVLPSAILGNAGDHLRLDGEVVAMLMTPVMQLGWHLIAAVDQWLDNHPV
jgi:hypothetical protein